MMKSFNWYGAVRAAFGAIGVGALLFGAALSSAAVVAPGQPPDKGTLFLELNGSGKLQFRWAQVGQTDVIQSIVDKSSITWKLTDLCTLVLKPTTAAATDTTPAAGLVTLPAGGGVTGFFGDDIGIKGSGQCTEISGAETLTIALGGALAGYQVHHTEINLQMKQATVVQVDATFNGKTQTFVVRGPGGVATGPAGATLIDCPFQSVTAEKNICRWTSDALWDSAVFRTLSGTWSIEGGTGGGGGAFSSFAITKISGTLDCDAQRQTITATDPTTGASASGARLQNTDKGSCTAIPYALSWTTDSDTGAPVLEYFKDNLGQAVATTFTIDWPNEPTPIPATGATNGVLGAVRLSQQEFLASEGLIPIDLCVGSPVYVLVEGELVLQSLTPPSGGFPDQSSLGGTQYGCVYDRRITLPQGAPGKIGIEEFIYLQGDWGAVRKL